MNNHYSKQGFTLIFKSIICIIICVTTHTLSAQVPNSTEGGDNDYSPLEGVFNSYVRAIGNDATSIRGEINNTGLGLSSQLFSFGELGTGRQRSSDLFFYGAIGHTYGLSVGGYGGLFSYGSDFTNPDVYVQIAGSDHGLRIVDGTEENGYVLTSDTDGFASWQPANSSLWEDLGFDDIRFGTLASPANVSINTNPDANASLYVHAPNGGFGPDTAAIYAYRQGSFIPSEGNGTSWSETGVTAAIKGFSDYGNEYSAAIAGYGWLDNNNSASIIGAEQNGNKWGALAYKDTLGRVWGGYIGAGDFHVSGDISASELIQGNRAIFETEDATYSGFDDAELLVSNLEIGISPVIGLKTSPAGDGAIIGVDIATDDAVFIGDPIGFYADINAAAFNVSSDRRVKKDIQEIDYSNFAQYMNYIRNIESASFRYTQETKHSRPAPHIGVIAQTLPEEAKVVMSKTPLIDNGETIYGASLADLQGLTLVGVKYLDHENQLKDQKITALNERLNAQQIELDELKNLVRELQNQMKN